MKFMAKVSPHCHRFPRMNHLNRDHSDEDARKKKKTIKTRSLIKISNKSLGKKTHTKLKKQMKSLTSITVTANHHRRTSHRPLNKNETYRLLMRTVGILPPKTSRNCFAEATVSLTSQIG